MFEPIAVVGRGAVLPGALTPAALWDNVAAGKDLVRPAAEGRWGLPKAQAMGTTSASVDRTWSDAGGYVDGFERVFDPTGFRIPKDEVLALDPLFQWVLHAGREALREAGIDGHARGGLVMGNLSFPSSSMAAYAEQVWLASSGLVGPASPPAHARNRFTSGLPAHLAAKALGLGAGSFALDAACASSLYAIKLACDRLHDRTAEVMVAGAVQRADDLFIHVGFCALSAMSKTGRSRPFHKDADGLVPAEGAGFVVLKRLSDAQAAGDRVLAVIRGVGLSNDGRGRGLLAPSEDGQARAMRQAYDMAGLAPSQITMVECHATGTPVGDATEIRSMSRLYEGLSGVPIGSLKSNMGHLITVAGVAALIKVIGAMHAGVRPPTLHVDSPNDALAGSPFRLLTKAEPWEGVRIAAISAFGFGGNNAHLLVEHVSSAPAPAPAPAPDVEVAIVGVGARVGTGDSAADLVTALAEGKPLTAKRQTVDVALEGLKFPPKDLEATLPQQLLVLEAAREAAEGRTLPRDRTAVLVGMGCDPEIARYGARWRLASWGQRWGADPAWIKAAQDAVQTRLEAAGVLGTMPNIPANRINSQLDLAGPSFTLSSEETSGTTALQIAIRALRAGEIDAAVVGAADLSHEPVHQAALAALGVTGREPADAAVALVLKRLDDAKRDGDDVIAVVDIGGLEARRHEGSVDDGGVDARRHEGDVGRASVPALDVGNPHAATSLVKVAAAALAVKRGLRPGGAPDLDRTVTITTSALEDGAHTVVVRGEGTATGFLSEAARLFVFAGAERRDVLARSQPGGSGPAKLVVVATEKELPERLAVAKKWLEQGGPAPEGVAFREKPVTGELAFVFGGAAAAYAGMGRELALALPELGERLSARTRELPAATGWVWGGGAPKHPLDQLWGASAITQLHAELTKGVLGLKPQATIGYSSGESNALFAMGAWTDLDAFVRDTWEGPVFTTELVGDRAAVRRARGGASNGWAAVTVGATPEAVKDALEPLAHVAVVNAPDECVVAGEPEAVGRVVAKLGGKGISVAYDIAVHAPEVEACRDAWWKLHERPTTAVPGVRFYTAATGSHFVPTSASAADAITGQAVGTLDFVRVIESAYADGVRVFVEHGPRGLCTAWIKRILGDREHVAVALDVQGRSGVRQALNAVAGLVAAGVPVDSDALVARLDAATVRPPAKKPSLTFPAHAKEFRLPPLAQTMAPAPKLPPVMEEGAAISLRPTPTPAPAPPPAPPPAPAFQAPAVAQPIAQPTAVQPPVVAAYEPPAPNEGMAAVYDELAAFQSHLAATHQQFLAEQAALHHRFLAMHAASTQHLLEAYGANPAPAPAPAPSPAPSRDVAPAVTYAPAPVVAPVVAKAPAPGPPVPVAPKPVVAPSSPGAGGGAGAGAGLPGPKFDRKQLEILASGQISSVFGPEFAGQDQYFRQVRMPEPPLLLADRVTGIDAVPKSMKTGRLWTETDVRADSWWLNEGYMPAGIHIESGQADLLLISWLGVDFLNKSERVYRLLGCELTWHEGADGHVLPRVGETLQYAIDVDGHAKQGDIRLMFFKYDCKIDGRPRLTVRGGQAGFFTDAELGDSGGILWAPETGEHSTTARLDGPALPTKSSFSNAELVAFTEGRPWDCFGPGWALTAAHVRTPKIQSGRMLFFDEVVSFDPKGGPWGRGYLRAEQAISANQWFFEGHFKNDPCMPGTLMFEGCVQAMAFYLAAMGYTLDRDGWRFEPVPEHKYLMRCRGQVQPTSKQLTYEVFVEEVHDGPIPMLFADLLCTVDGLKAFHARRVGLRLVPDWPMAAWKERPAGVPQIANGNRGVFPLAPMGGMKGHVEKKPVATSPEGFPFDYSSLLACAWGKPSTAFGPIYERFDGTRRVARLPGPPYHFMTRITKTEGPMGGLKVGSAVEVEYDVPKEVWYFDENGHATMPFCVLMEAALQPCGWLASYIGCALTTDIDLMFRNLDGTGQQLAEILPVSGTLKTIAKLTNLSKSAGMIIVNFTVECFLGDVKAYEMKTVFGFFPKEAFENQVGLPVTDEDRVRIAKKSDYLVDLTSSPEQYCGESPKLAAPMLRMIDRVSAYEPKGGKHGKGWARADKDVDPNEWFFKAHFFQDPVQPGSLGVEALCQLLQWWMIENNLGEAVPNARFEPVALDVPVTWKYRGQVVPKNERITTEIDVVDVKFDEKGVLAVAEAHLWVDGKRIYTCKNLGMRIVSGPAPAAKAEEVLDASVDTWLADHAPTWTMPALPMMSMVDRLVGSGNALRDVQVKRWLPFPGGPIRLKTETVPGETPGATGVVLSAWREAKDAALSRFEPVATGTIATAGARPQPLAPISGEVVPDPYASGELFHGPAFHYLRELRRGPNGASAILDAGAGSVPYGNQHQGLLDAITHAIPHDSLHLWSKEIAADLVAYPYRIPNIDFFGPIPTSGEVRVEVRFAGFEKNQVHGLAHFDAQLIGPDGVLVALHLVEILLPKGPIGMAPREQRIAFLRDRRFVPGVALSEVGARATTATAAGVKQSDWLPGNVARIYGIPDVSSARPARPGIRRLGSRPADDAADAASPAFPPDGGGRGGLDVVAQVAVKDHVAARAFSHPSRVHVDGDSAIASVRPLRRHPVTVTRSADRVTVADNGPAVLDISPVRNWWDDWFGIGRWPVEDLYYGLIERFIGDVVVADPDAYAAVRGRSCLYLANHQVGVESLLFSVLASGLSQVSTVTLAKAEHRTTWLGLLIQHCFTWPGARDPKVITFFDREDKRSLLGIIGELAAEMQTVGKSVMVHVEGTRSVTCRKPVEKMTSAFIDMAMAVNAPIVPVRFVGALPVEPLETRLEFPVGYGRQDIWLGRPLLPEELATLPLRERKAFVIDAINGLGPSNADEVPTAPDPAFEHAVADWVAQTGASPEHAALYRTLERRGHVGAPIQRLLEGARSGSLALGSSAEDQWLAELARRLFGPNGPRVS